MFSTTSFKLNVENTPNKNPVKKILYFIRLLAILIVHGFPVFSTKVYRNSAVSCLVGWRKKKSFNVGGRNPVTFKPKESCRTLILQKCTEPKFTLHHVCCYIFNHMEKHCKHNFYIRWRNETHFDMPYGQNQVFLMIHKWREGLRYWRTFCFEYYSASVFVLPTLGDLAIYF